MVICCHELLQLMNTATTIKLIKLPQRIDDRFDMNNKPDAYNFIKRKLQHGYYPVNFAIFLRTPFL